MAINRALKNTRKEVKWNGETAATVRGLSPNDVATVISDNGEAISLVMSAFEDADKIPLHGGAERIAEALIAQAPTIFGKVASSLPGLLAELIAVAADDTDDEAVQTIMDWPIGLQSQVMIDVASMTFAGPEGFRLFVGNVAALVKTVDTMTSAQKMTKLPPGFNSGSPESSTSDAG